jgi:RNA polymerase sigma-70 factor (ECF subfamily)
MTLEWSSVLQSHRSWLRSVVAARVTESDGVEEVWQEICLAAVRQAAPLVDSARVAPWLYRLAVRQSLLYRRGKGRERKRLQGAADRRRADGVAAGDPLTWLLAEERRENVRLALRRLPACDAQLLLLKYVDNWSYRQMAEHLGVSDAAVESRLHRARGSLRKLLQEEA